MCKPPPFRFRLALVATLLVTIASLIPTIGGQDAFAQEGSVDSTPAAPPAMVAQALPPCDPITPFPEGVTVTPPAADVPPHLAAFSGAWQGKGVAGRASRLVVESIEGNVAHIAFGIEGVSDQQGISQASAMRTEASVLPDGRLTLGTGPRIDFTLAVDQQSLDAAFQVGGMVLRRVTMSRCSL